MTLRRLTIIAIALACTQLAACASSSNKAVTSGPSTVSSASTAATSTTAVAVTSTTIAPQSMVDSAALTIADFPTGWATDASLQSTGSSGFCGKSPSQNAAPLRAQRRVAFAQDPNNGPLVQDWVLLYADAAAATQVLAVTRSAATSCTSWKFQGQQVAIDQLSFPATASESVAYRLTDAGTAIDYVIMRTGSAVVQVTTVGLDADGLALWVHKALDKARVARIG